MLIIGASGLIGHCLFEEAKNRNIDVIGTYCNNMLNKEYIKFDLEKDDLQDLYFLMEHFDNKVAIICAAITNIERCFFNKSTAININIDNTIKLIKQLYKEKYKIIYLSTDNVFDGNKNCYSEEDNVNPINIYGFTKSKVEEYLNNNVYNSCILRLSKVVSPYKIKNNMFYNWYIDAFLKKTIYCIENNMLSIVDVRDVISVIFKVIDNDLSGIYNISNGEFLKRVDLVSKFLNCIDIKTNVLVKPLNEFNFKDKKPLSTCMSNAKISKDLNVRFNSTNDIIIDFKNMVIDKREI